MLQGRLFKTWHLYYMSEGGMEGRLGHLYGILQVADKTFAAPRICTYLKRGLGMTGAQRVADKTLAAPRIILPDVQPPILGGGTRARPLNRQSRLTPVQIWEETL